MSQKFDKSFVQGRPSVVVNPNPGREFNATVHGSDGRQHFMKFPPMERTQVPGDLKGALLRAAGEASRNAHEQAAAEEEQYIMLESSDNPLLKQRAMRFCDPETKLPPKTKLWERPPLVDMDSEDGKRYWLEAVDELKADGKFVDDAETTRECENVEVPKYDMGPELDWKKSRMYKWIFDNGGTASQNFDEKKLFDRAITVLRSRWELLQKYEIEVRDTETDTIIQWSGDGTEIVWPEKVLADARG